ncbi:MAG: DISARM system helicase DrmA, partial [Angustibacter sp.]
MTQAGAGSLQVRDELEDLIERDLLGPADGPEEELPHGVSPSEQYVLGRLVAESRAGSGSTGAARPADPDEGDAEGLESASATRSGTMAASSLGLSFMVSPDVHEIKVQADWGRYATTSSEHLKTPTGRPRTVWRREPAGGDVLVPVGEDRSTEFVPDPSQPDVVLAMTSRMGRRGKVRLIHLVLRNRQEEPLESVDTSRLFQAGLTVTAATAEAPIFLGHNDPKLLAESASRMDETDHLKLLHRRSRKYATGRQCAVEAEVTPGATRAWRLRTTCFPTSDIPQVVAGSVRNLPGLQLDMGRLGNQELAADDLVAGLRPLALGYRQWLAEQRTLSETDPEVRLHHATADYALSAAEGIAERLNRAIDLLRDNGEAREAFRFANQAMARQRVRGELVRRRIADPTAD